MRFFFVNLLRRLKVSEISDNTQFDSKTYNSFFLFVYLFCFLQMTMANKIKLTFKKLFPKGISLKSNYTTSMYMRVDQTFIMPTYISLGVIRKQTL